MPEENRTEEALRRALEANVRYYQALGRVTLDYLQALAGIWGNVMLPVDLGTLRMPGMQARSPATREPTAPAAESGPALVLEAEAGQEARGAFMVDNSLGRPVSTTVTVSAFRSESGREASPALRVEPSVVALEPGTSALVHLVATVPGGIEPGVSYRADVDVPGLAERGIPVVLRRRAAAAGDRPAKAATPRRGGAPKGRSRKAKATEPAGEGPGAAGAEPAPRRGRRPRSDGGAGG